MSEDASKTKGPFKVLSSEVAYKNPWIEVREEKVIRPDGQHGLFGIIDYGRGVSVVAMDSSENIFLIKEFYYALDEYGIQVPSGDIDGEETALEGAKRELLEEAGMTANTWIDLGYVNPLTTILRSPAYLFLAQGVQKKAEPEDGIELIITPLSQAYQMVLDSKITHAPSCLAILKAWAHLKGPAA